MRGFGKEVLADKIDDDILRKKGGDIFLSSSPELCPFLQGKKELLSTKRGREER